MTTERLDPKLTESLSRLYAEWRPMSEKGAELLPPQTTSEAKLKSGLILPRSVRAAVIPEKQEGKPVLEIAKKSYAPSSKEVREHAVRQVRRETVPPSREVVEHEKRRKERKGIVEESIPGANEFVGETIEQGGRDIDKGFSYMLVELNEQTREQPLKQWRDDKLALFYQEWTDVTAHLNKELARKDLSPEEAKKDRDMLRMAEGIKKALLVQAKDKVAVIAGELDPEEKPADANKIQNKEIKQEFIKLLVKLTDGKIRTPEQIRAVRMHWEELSLKWRGKLSKDPEAQKAFERIRTHLVIASKELQARREQKPIRHQARAEMLMEERDKDPEDPNPQVRHTFSPEEEMFKSREPRSRRVDDEEGLAEYIIRDGREVREKVARLNEEHGGNPLAKVNEINAQFSEFSQARAQSERSKDKQERVMNEADKKALKEANSIWTAEKKKLDRLSDVKERLLEEETDWTKYGWSPKEKDHVQERFIDVLRMHKPYESIDILKHEAQILMVNLLVNGQTAIEAAGRIPDKDGRNDRDRGKALEGVVKEFIYDDDVLLILYNPHMKKIIQESTFKESPRSMQQLAWQIGYSEPTFSEDRETPTWERRVRLVDNQDRRVDKDGFLLKPVYERAENGEVRHVRYESTGEKGDGIKFKVHEVVNKENILMWYRDRVNFLQEQGPSERHNFFSEVKIEKDNDYNAVSLQKMFANEEAVFTGAETEEIPKEYREGIRPEIQKRHPMLEDYKDLSTMLQMEAYLVGMVRNLHLAYDENKGSEEELIKQTQQLFDKNHLTKDVWGNKPLWQFMTLLPEKFDSLDKLDGGVGASVVKSYLAYYHISDFEALQQTLGEKASLFTIEGLREARDKVVKDGIKYGDTYEDGDRDYYDFSLQWDDEKKQWKKEMKDEALNGAFEVLEFDEKTGQVTKSRIKDRKKFTSFINIFSSYTPESRVEKMIKKAILKDASAGEELSETNESYAHLIAEHLVRFTGAAAHNDTSFVGYDALTRLIHTQGYREKMNKGEKKILEDKEQGIYEEWMANRGGRVGNVHTIAQFKQLVVNPMLAITTLSEHEVKGHDGKTLYNKPILYVLEELNQERDRMREKLSKTFDQAKEENKSEDEQLKIKEQIKEEYGPKYRDVAKQMRFTKNAEQHYLNNMFNRGVPLNGIVRGGKGIDFEKYWGYSTEIGTWFKIKEFQDDFTKMVTDVRYAYSTYGNLGYNMTIRGYDYEKKEWRWMTLGEQMFGEWMLNIPAFKTADNKIDYYRVSKKSHVLYKQFLLAYVAGEFVAARQFNKWSSTPRHGMDWYERVVEVLEKIPGNIEVTQKDIKALNIDQQFFPKEMINWLRRETGTTRANLYGWAGMKNIFLGGRRGKKEESVWDGISEAIGLFIGGSLKV